MIGTKKTRQDTRHIKVITFTNQTYSRNKQAQWAFFPQKNEGKYATYSTKRSDFYTKQTWRFKTPRRKKKSKKRQSISSPKQCGHWCLIQNQIGNQEPLRQEQISNKCPKLKEKKKYRTQWWTQEVASPALLLASPVERESESGYFFLVIHSIDGPIDTVNSNGISKQNQTLISANPDSLIEPIIRS